MSNTPAFTLPFGKHKSQNLLQVPTDYLQWLVRQEWPDEYVKNQVAFELERRSGEQDAVAVATGGLPAIVGPELARAIVEAGRAALIDKHQGDPALVLAIEATTEALIQWALDTFEGSSKHV